MPCCCRHISRFSLCQCSSREKSQHYYPNSEIITSRKSMIVSIISRISDWFGLTRRSRKRHFTLEESRGTSLCSLSIICSSLSPGLLAFNVEKPIPAKRVWTDACSQTRFLPSIVSLFMGKSTQKERALAHILWKNRGHYMNYPVHLMWSQGICYPSFRLK